MKTPFAVYLFIVFISAVFGAFLWPYTINEWLVFFSKEPSIVWWHGVILGFVPLIGQATIPAAVVTWILMLFL